jgi:hypothetical protein
MLPPPLLFSTSNFPSPRDNFQAYQEVGLLVNPHDENSGKTYHLQSLCKNRHAFVICYPGLLEKLRGTEVQGVCTPDSKITILIFQHFKPERLFLNSLGQRDGFQAC